MYEDLDHLFFQCAYVGEVWSSVLTWQGVGRGIMNWTDEVQWAVKFMKRESSTTVLVYKLAMVSTVYCLWLERNSRIFQQKQQPTRSLIRHII